MNFFLRDVWKQSKIVFAFFVVFMLGTAWCTFYKIEITPFFLWAHYSDREVPTGRFERIYIKVNGEILDLPKLSRPTREMIQLPTEYFVHLEEYSYQTATRHILRKYLQNRCSPKLYEKIEKRLVNTKADKSEYVDWLKRYIERIYGVKVEHLEIGTRDLVIRKDHTVIRENTHLIQRY